MAKGNDYDSRHSSNLDRYAQRIDALFKSLIKEAAKLKIETGLEDGSKAKFSLEKFPKTSKKANELLSKMRRDMRMIIENGVKKEWELSEAKNAALINRLTAKSGIPEDVVRSLQPRNADALEAFLLRTERGLTLSNRVWNITSQAMAEVEMAVGMSLGKGKDAQALSRDVRHLLKSPNEMWRRYYATLTKPDGTKVKEPQWRRKVVGDDGKVRFVSEPLSHPGRGVYRSSYRNALRLAVTETNMAYHKADSLAWQQSTACIGIEIMLSNNHTCRGVKGLFYDICDEFAGKYPKYFVFTGWHPFCRCVAVPITAKRDEFIAYLKDKMAGKDVSDVKFSGEVKSVPKKFRAWEKANAERIQDMRERGTLPQFLENKRERRRRQNKELYFKLLDDNNYKEVEYDQASGGVKAMHIGHSLNKEKGWYEKAVQEVAYKRGHSVILEDEPQYKSDEKSCEGLWNGLKFEIAGVETGISNNIRNGLKHCASKPGAKVAVLFFPNKNFSIAEFKLGYRKYYGLRGTEQYAKFEYIYCIQGEKISLIKRATAK